MAEETVDAGSFSWCLMLVRLNDAGRGNPVEALKRVQRIRDEYMSRFKQPADSTPRDFCEGALTGEYDFYALFKFNGDGPVWLAARLRADEMFAQVVTMNATPISRFKHLFA